MNIVVSSAHTHLNMKMMGSSGVYGVPMQMGLFQKNNSTKKLLKTMNLDKVPHDLNEAINMIIESLSIETKQFISDNDPAVVHHGFGTGLRNNWSLWDRDTHLVQWFINNLGIGHADDISGTILSAVWANVKNEHFVPIEHVKKYKEHWMNMGVDPITQNKL